MAELPRSHRSERTATVCGKSPGPTGEQREAVGGSEPIVGLSVLAAKAAESVWPPPPPVNTEGEDVGEMRGELVAAS